MPNHMKFCGCKSCRRGRSSGGGMKWLVTAIVRKFRRKAKQDLKQGKTPDKVISCPYTD